MDNGFMPQDRFYCALSALRTIRDSNRQTFASKATCSAPRVPAMAHIETKDPFGFVGSHVVRRDPRRRDEEHGWLTRYDETLDCYTLFVPGGDPPRQLSRGEVMQFLAAPNIELHDDDQAAFPPPVEDTTSRYVGVSLRRPKRRRDESDDESKGGDDDLRGFVTLFLPFADRYRVEYEDGASEELSESELIDGMIALLTSPFFSSPRRVRTHSSVRQTRSSVDLSDEDDVRLPRRRRKRQRVSSALDNAADGPVVLVPTGDVMVVESSVAEESKTDDEADLGEEKAPAPVNIVDLLGTEGDGANAAMQERQSVLEATDESVAVDTREAADQDSPMPEVTETKQPEEETATETEKKSVPFYLVDETPHEATRPLPKRTMAYQLIRASLLNLLDRREASEVKFPVHYDLLRNPDIKDRDAVSRFADADGFKVMGHLLKVFAEDEDDGVVEIDESDEELDGEGARVKRLKRMQRDEEVLSVLKLVAMMPVPTRDQVMSTGIGKIIGFLGKRSPPGRRVPLPKSICALARWIRAKWIKNITAAAANDPRSKSKKPVGVTTAQSARRSQQGRRGGRTGSPGRRLLRDGKLQRATRPQTAPLRRTQPVEPPRHVDNTPIPRRPQGQRTPAPPPPTSVPAPTPPRHTSGGLKPDWMRYKESLSRSRFCIDDNSNVDTRLYHNSHGVGRPPIMNLPVVTSQLADAEADAPLSRGRTNPEQPASAGGPDGVYGRSQRLRFAKNWHSVEFNSQLPPTSTVPSRDSTRSQSRRYSPTPSPSHRAPTRSILRRSSKYGDVPAIDTGDNEAAPSHTPASGQ